MEIKSWTDDTIEERYKKCGDPFADDFNQDMANDIEREVIMAEMESDAMDIDG